jgi:hypothetical protein
MTGDESGHPARASSVDEAFEAHVGPVREALAALFQASDELRDQWGSLPAPNSPAMAELADVAQFEANSPWGDPVQDAHNIGQLLLFAMGDCVEALVALLSPLRPTPVYAHVVLARAALEQASRAWWLFEPGIALRLRVARVMNERIFGIAQQDPLPISQQDRMTASQRLNDLLAAAEGLGFEIVTSRRPNVGYLEEMRPGQTQLVKALLGAPDGDASLGALVYGLFSAVAHGTTFGLMSSVRAAQNPAGAPGVQWGAVYTDSGDVIHVLAAVILGTREALGRRNDLFGWKSDSWSAGAAEALQAVKRSLPSKTG